MEEKPEIYQIQSSSTNSSASQNEDTQFECILGSLQVASTTNTPSKDYPLASSGPAVSVTDEGIKQLTERSQQLVVSSSDDSNDKEIIESNAFLKQNESESLLFSEELPGGEGRSHVSPFIRAIGSNSNSNENSREESPQILTAADVQQKEADSSFATKMASPQAQVLKAKIIDFIRLIQSKYTSQTQKSKPNNSKLSKLLEESIGEFEEEFSQLFPSSNSENDPHSKLTGEAMEAIVIKPLYPLLISNYPVKQDKRLEFYFRVFEFIKLEWFDISAAVLNHPNYPKAIANIKRIDSFKTPREKVSAIVSCCQLLSKALQSVYPSSPIGADQLLPTLIYLLISAKPVRPYTNLNFSRDYRCGWRLDGHDQYYLATYESALEFIDEIDAKKLKISEQLFEEQYRLNYAKYKEMGYLLDFEGHKWKESLSSEQAMHMLGGTLKQMEDLASKMNVDSELGLKFVNTNLSAVKLTQLPEMFAEYSMLTDSYREMLQKTTKIVQSLKSFQDQSDDSSLSSYSQKQQQQNKKKSIFQIF